MGRVLRGTGRRQKELFDGGGTKLRRKPTTTHSNHRQWGGTRPRNGNQTPQTPPKARGIVFDVGSNAQGRK